MKTISLSLMKADQRDDEMIINDGKLHLKLLI